jgi:hypothetical protein
MADTSTVGPARKANLIVRVRQPQNRRPAQEWTPPIRSYNLPVTRKARHRRRRLRSPRSMPATAAPQANPDLAGIDMAADRRL